MLSEAERWLVKQQI